MLVTEKYYPIEIVKWLIEFGNSHVQYHRHDDEDLMRNMFPIFYNLSECPEYKSNKQKSMKDMALILDNIQDDMFFKELGQLGQSKTKEIDAIIDLREHFKIT